ncbi:MAG: hypothetical protein ACOYJ2_02830 [Rickettsiales bacterium]
MKQTLAYALLASSLLATPAFAGAVGYVKSPGVDKGKFQVEYKGVRLGDDKKSKNNNQEHEFEVYYGLTDRLKFGMEVEAERESGESLDVEKYAPNLQYELTEQGEWWLSSAIYGAYGFADKASAANKAKLIAIVEREQGPWEILANLKAEREMGDNRKNGIIIYSSLQTVYEWRDYIEPGFEWHAKHGKTNDFSDENNREHYVGPIIEGDLYEDEKSEVEYQFGYFWGVNDNAADNAARVLLEYSVKF